MAPFLMAALLWPILIGALLLFGFVPGVWVFLLFLALLMGGLRRLRQLTTAEE